MIDNPSKKFRILEVLLLHFFKQGKWWSLKCYGIMVVVIIKNGEICVDLHSWISKAGSWEKEWVLNFTSTVFISDPWYLVTIDILWAAIKSNWN